ITARMSKTLIVTSPSPSASDLRACGWFDHDLYVECEHHAQNRIECGAYFPSKGSVETVATQPDLLRKSCHTLSAHHVTNCFRDDDRISHRERVVQVLGDHLRVVPIFSSVEKAGFGHSYFPSQS